MKWHKIRKMATSTGDLIEEGLLQNGDRVHESMLKSYQVLEKVKDYLKRGVPADVILELIEEAYE